jgi:putative membrane protein
MSLTTATVLMMFSAFCFGAGVWRHLNPGARPPLPDVSQLSPYLLIAINGFLALVALAAMVGIWFGKTP